MPDANKPTPANDDDTLLSGETATTGTDEARSDEPAPDPVSDQEPTVEPANPSGTSSTQADPLAEQEPKVKPQP